MRFRGFQTSNLAFGALLCAAGLCSVALAQPPGDKTGPFGYGVSSENPTASRDAGQILAQGGSAADAAVVAALVAGVASPTSSGIGGGGFALVLSDQKIYILDFRETAPSGLKAEALEVDTLSKEEAGHWVGVPGEVKGLFELHRRAGKLPWRTLVKKAADRAHQGYPVSQHLASMLSYAEGKLRGVPGFSALYFPGGKPALVGTRLTNPALGRTLDKIAQEGPAGFYEGPVAESLVKAAQAHGGSLSLQDLKAYAVLERAPLSVHYEGVDVFTMPPPSAGGLMVIEVLKLFPADYLKKLGKGTPAYQHMVSEALRAAVSDRMRYIGDPAHQAIDLEALLSDARMEKRREMLSLERTHSLPRFGLEEHGTHALITADRYGNAISLTTTINRLFGAKIHAEDSGVVLNDELDDFTRQADILPFGMKESPNRPRPGARPTSSMTPTLVLKDGAFLLGLGGSGGTAIATNVTQVLLSTLVFETPPLDAVSAPRIYIPTKEKHLLVEKGTPKAHVEDLERRGEIVGEMPFSGTAVQVLQSHAGTLRGAADPRKHGLAVTGR